MISRKFLTQKEAKRYRPAINSILVERAEDWGLQGWSLVGKGDRLRVAVRVPLRRISPKVRASHIDLGGLRLKVAVLPTFAFQPPSTTAGSAFVAQRSPLAPGSPINIEGEERGGVGAFIAIDGVPHLLTCGHVFSDSRSIVQRIDTEETVAIKTHDLRQAPWWLDAAACELTAEGIDAATSSSTADSWVRRVHEPSSLDHDKTCAFWPTHEDAPDPIELTVLSSATTFFPFCSAPAQDCSFVEVEYAAPPGDSGGPLMLNDAYYGICVGTNSHSTFFTPVSSVLRALRASGKKVSPWVPG
jgi:hypothetical protein